MMPSSLHPHPHDRATVGRLRHKFGPPHPQKTTRLKGLSCFAGNRMCAANFGLFVRSTLSIQQRPFDSCSTNLVVRNQKNTRFKGLSWMLSGITTGCRRAMLCTRSQLCEFHQTQHSNATAASELESRKTTPTPQ